MIKKIILLALISTSSFAINFDIDIELPTIPFSEVFEAGVKRSQVVKSISADRDTEVSRVEKVAKRTYEVELADGCSFVAVLGRNLRVSVLKDTLANCSVK